jgi:hypothetical protein
MSKRYLSLKKRPTVAQRPYCMGSSSYASKNIEKLNEETKKLEEWKNLK